MTIRNPIEWVAGEFRLAGSAMGSAVRTVYWTKEGMDSLVPLIRRISVADLWTCLAKGTEDLSAYRTDVIYLTFIYPVIGLLMARLAFGQGMLPLVFPLVAGFALVGPFAAVGLYEMSRRREQGREVSWADAFGVLGSPRFGAVAALGVVLMIVFGLWLFAAETIYRITFGPALPVSILGFVQDVLLTPSGWALIVLGVGAGFVFAVAALVAGVISFPLLLDREIGLDTAVWTSIQAARANPVPIAVWGLIVASGLVLGSIPFLIGLVIVIPLLGHATWHLYRRVLAG
jgi:uncharacterized membrane protein